MKQKTFIVSVFLILAFALAACGPQVTPAVVEAQPEANEVPMEDTEAQVEDAPASVEAVEAPAEEVLPAVEVIDQEITNGSVVIPSVSMAVDGWVVIHTTNAEGKPGPVIGYVPVPAGSSSDVLVQVDPEQITPQLFAMLHIDAGAAGEYEFPGDDVPVKDGEAIVMKPFNLNGLSAFVRTSDQAIQDSTVTVNAIYMTQTGWVVIHSANDEGKPGPVIGYAALPEGFSSNIPVMVETANATPKVFAMLHIDAGAPGTYEFPGDDVPVKDGEAIVMVPFMIEKESASIEVVISDFSFSPNDLQVEVGTTITWTNQDAVKHTATSDDGTFDSGSLGKGGSFSFTFTETGTFNYFCNFHPSMTGVVTVVP